LITLEPLNSRGHESSWWPIVHINYMCLLHVYLFIVCRLNMFSFLGFLFNHCLFNVHYILSLLLDCCFKYSFVFLCLLCDMLSVLLTLRKSLGLVLSGNGQDSCIGYTVPRAAHVVGPGGSPCGSPCCMPIVLAHVVGPYEVYQIILKS